ncbi:HAMP domain-containing sensor histidine kinase [Desulfosporosinus sp. PR]|uniref:sensor histidine kinase n=1 Tax=Candidatus Desulfosporosinus nitrosoreducens TaxID=3401928 RepID=UPI0027EF2BE6|nr:HAMP domain-containing sensor histidine kinase [Desulfosporosinus sp. PR]MDQ7095626.1 HAMP domain-containing sensor histidine kinase [Desulfosporosinus sp. PR]
MRRVIKSPKVWIGIGLFLLGVLIPYWLKPQLIGLDQLLQTMHQKTDGSALMVNAFLVVSINTMISIPQFLSVVMLGDGMAEAINRPIFKTLIPLIVVPLAYVIVNGVTPLNYSFSATDIFLWLSIALMQNFSRQEINIGMKLIVFSQLIFGVAWLNQVPFLSPYGFGQGSLSIKIKEAAAQIGFDHVLALYANVLFFIFVASAVTLWIYLILYMEKWAISQDLLRAQLEANESRAGREVLHLVHDLKTPLATIEGLVSLIESRWPDPKMQEYCQTIYGSINSMSTMVSEILYEDRKNWCELKELVDYIRASRLSGTNLSVDIEMDEEPQSTLYINKIRLTRAIINLIDNALDAIQGRENGRVVLRAKTSENAVKLEVEDNGYGISESDVKRIWKTGYSTKNHPGFGLAFVRQVAEGHEGFVNIRSEVGQGTKVWITLPLGEGQ